MRASHSEARWSDPDKLHLTLVFLGPTEPDEVPRLTEAMREVAGRWQPFDVVTEGAGGYFGGRRGGVAWLTIAQGRAELRRLSRELDSAMAAGTYERMAPRPHVTVARRVDGELLAALRAPEIRFVVDRLQLLRSHTGPGGARYEVLATLPL